MSFVLTLSKILPWGSLLTLCGFLPLGFVLTLSEVLTGFVLTLRRFYNMFCTNFEQGFALGLGFVLTLRRFLHYILYE